MRIIEDLLAFSDNSRKKMVVTIFTNPCFHSVCLYRISSCFYKLHLTILAKIVWYLNRIIFNIDIDYRSSLSGGLVIKHGLGIVIGKDVISRGRLTIYQGVTLGGNAGKKALYMEMGRSFEIEQPVLLENVVIYTDAKVFGPVVIGRNNIIKAGSIVISDMPNQE